MENRRKLDCSFDGSGAVLLVRADIRLGWDRKPGEDAKTYCFTALDRVYWQGGYVHVSLFVFPRPGGLTDDWAKPPELADHDLRRTTDGTHRYRVTGDGTRERIVDGVGVTVANGLIVISAQLEADNSGRPKTVDFARQNGRGLWLVERIYQEPITGYPYQYLDVQVRFTFEPPERPAPVERSFWNRFLPGGRPESNRRRF